MCFWNFSEVKLKLNFLENRAWYEAAFSSFQPSRNHLYVIAS